MIILRHKIYSSRFTRVIKGVTGVKHKIGRALDNAGLEVGERLGILKKEMAPERYRRFQPASNIEINRRTINTRDNILDSPRTGREIATKIGRGSKNIAIKAADKTAEGIHNTKANIERTIIDPKYAIDNAKEKGINTVKQTKESLARMVENPGKTVDSAIEATTRNPIAVGSQIAGKALMITPVDPVIKAAPIGGLGVATEVALKKIPTYKNATEGLANKYHRNTKFRGKLQEIVNKTIEGGTNIGNMVIV